MMLLLDWFLLHQTSDASFQNFHVWVFFIVFGVGRVTHEESEITAAPTDRILL